MNMELVISYFFEYFSQIVVMSFGLAGDCSCIYDMGFAISTG